MLRIKESVDLRNLQLVMTNALFTLADLFTARGYILTVTAGQDGVHMEGSLHYRGYAVDLRSRDIPEDQRAGLLAAMKETLGPKFDIILEGDHFHVEYDPQHDGGKSL